MSLEEIRKFVVSVLVLIGGSGYGEVGGFVLGRGNSISKVKM